MYASKTSKQNAWSWIHDGLVHCVIWETWDVSYQDFVYKMSPVWSYTGAIVRVNYGCATEMELATLGWMHILPLCTIFVVVVADCESFATCFVCRTSKYLLIYNYKIIVPNMLEFSEIWLPFSYLLYKTRPLSEEGHVAFYIYCTFEIIATSDKKGTRFRFLLRWDFVYFNMLKLFCFDFDVGENGGLESPFKIKPFSMGNMRYKNFIPLLFNIFVA